MWRDHPLTRELGPTLRKQQAHQVQQLTWQHKISWTNVCQFVQHWPVLPHWHWDSRHAAQHGYHEIGRRITMVTEDTKKTTYLFQQRVSVALQKGNVVSSRKLYLLSNTQLQLYTYIFNIWCPQLCAGGPNKKMYFCYIVLLYFTVFSATAFYISKLISDIIIIIVINIINISRKNVACGIIHWSKYAGLWLTLAGVRIFQYVRVLTYSVLTRSIPPTWRRGFMLCSVTSPHLLCRIGENERTGRLELWLRRTTIIKIRDSL